MTVELTLIQILLILAWFFVCEVILIIFLVFRCHGLVLIINYYVLLYNNMLSIVYKSIASLF